MFSFLDLFPRAFAVNAIKPVGTADPNSSSDATGLISAAGDNIVNFLFLLGGLLAVIYLLWAGVQYITAGGNADKAKSARQAIINAVIGIIIMMAAFAIIRFATSVGGWISKGAPTAGNAGSSGSSSGSTNLGGDLGDTATGGLGNSGTDASSGGNNQGAVGNGGNSGTDASSGQ